MKTRSSLLLWLAPALALACASEPHHYADTGGLDAASPPPGGPTRPGNGGVAAAAPPLVPERWPPGGVNPSPPVPDGGANPGPAVPFADAGWPNPYPGGGLAVARSF